MILVLLSFKKSNCTSDNSKINKQTNKEGWKQVPEILERWKQIPEILENVKTISRNLREFEFVEKWNQVSEIVEKVTLVSTMKL